MPLNSNMTQVKSNNQERRFPTAELPNNDRTKVLQMARNVRRDSGFTLIELMVLLVIMGMATMLILPSFTSGLQGLELEAACRDLATHMKRARFEAIGRHAVRRIIVTRDDTGAGYYVLANEFGEQIGSVDLPDGIVPQTVDNTPLPWRVNFYSNGRSSGGAIGMLNRQEKLLYVRADAVTGLAKVSPILESQGRPR